MKRRSNGFTLLEVLVALVLLTLFAVTSYRALDAVLTAERYSSAEMAHWRHLALAFSRIKTDFANAVAGVESRPGRPRGLRAGEDGSGMPYLDLDRLLPQDQVGGVQRVGYVFRDGALRRRVWPEVISASNPPTETPILADLSGVVLRYLDVAGQWHPDWVPDKASGALPRAVEMQFQFVSGTTLRRVFLLQ